MKEQQTLKELVEFARTSMDEMQMKINYYKEKSDSIEKLERDLSEVPFYYELNYNIQIEKEHNCSS